MPLLNSSSVKDLFISLLGTGITSILGFFFFILVSRELGPYEFGLFSALIAIIVIISDTTDMGVSAGLAKFVGKYEVNGKNETVGRFLMLSLMTKISLALFVVGVGFIFADTITKLLFNNSNSSHLLGLSLLGGVVMSLYSFTSFTLQARKKYLANSLLNISGNILRLLLPLILLSTYGLSSLSAISFYIIGFLIPSIVGLFFIPIKLLFFIPTKKEFYEFLHFNKYLALAGIMYTLLTRVDNLLILNLSNPIEAGLYGSAQRVTFIFPLIAAALASVWSPRFSAFKAKGESLIYFRKALLLVSVLSLVILVFVPFSSSIINIIFGSAYMNASLPLGILIVSWALFLITVPAIQYITYYIGKSYLYALIILMQFITVILLDLLLIPSLGSLGASVAFLLGNLIAAVSAYSIMLYTILWQKK